MRSSALTTGMEDRIQTVFKMASVRSGNGASRLACLGRPVFYACGHHHLCAERRPGVDAWRPAAAAAVKRRWKIAESQMYPHAIRTDPSVSALGRDWLEAEREITPKG